MKYLIIVLLLSGCAYGEGSKVFYAEQKDKCERHGGVFKGADGCDISYHIEYTRQPGFGKCFKLDKTPVSCKEIEIEKHKP